MDRKEKICICALGRLFGFEPRLAHSLMEHLGSAAALFDLDKDGLETLLGPFSKYSKLISSAELDRTASELDTLEKNGAGYLAVTEDDYPRRLRECEDAPLGLYYRASDPPGNIFNAGRSTAIVGTRDISLYGKEWCRRIVSALAGSGTCIVSGLALGTDIIAHTSALDAGLPGIAVLPTGIDDIYPARHRGAAQRIASSRGSALVTDYPPGTAPVAINFIRRNRIIAALSDATILVESRLKGGGMITARLAASYDRSVYALPGRIDDINSQGCNLLIRQQIAESISDLPALVESLGFGQLRTLKKRNLETEIERKYQGTYDQQTVSRLARVAVEIKKCRGISTEELCRHLDLPFSEVSELCGILESDSIVEMDLLQRCSINYY